MLEFWKEVNGVEYRIVHRKGFSIIGFRKRITLQFTGENHQIDSLNALLTEDARGRLLACNDELPKGIVSVSADFSDRTREGSYSISILASLPL